MILGEKDLRRITCRFEAGRSRSLYTVPSLLKLAVTEFWRQIQPGFGLSAPRVRGFRCPRANPLRVIRPPRQNKPCVAFQYYDVYSDTPQKVNGHLKEPHLRAYCCRCRNMYGKQGCSAVTLGSRTTTLKEPKLHPHKSTPRDRHCFGPAHRCFFTAPLLTT